MLCQLICIALTAGASWNVHAARAADAGPEPKAPAAVLAIKAKLIHLGDGRSIENGVLLVEAGRIRAVGAGVEIPEDADVIEHPGTISPGLIACHSYSGVRNESTDPTRAVLTQARISDAFDPAHPDYALALKAGITTMVLTPQPNSLVGGFTGVVKTAGGRVLRREAHLAISLASDAQMINRYPTSPVGAMAELEDLLTRGEPPFDDVSSGRMPVLIAARSRNEIQRALEFAQRHKLRGSIGPASLAGELIDEVKQSGLSVVVGPFDTGAERRVLRSAVALAEAGIPIAFGIDAPMESPQVLRLSAAMCVREGLEPAAALKALTSDGARIAGVADEVGRLERGLSADFVLWSGDPLDLSSSVDAVFVDGKSVFGGQR